MSQGLPAGAILSFPGAAAAAIVVRSEGAPWVSVIVKATFAFASDAAMPRVDPGEILRREAHHESSPARSIRSTADTAPFLAHADVTFTGDGHSLAGPVNELLARIAIFDAEETYLNKAILLRDPKGFERMPIVYERAYGGHGSIDNPLGCGLVSGSGEPTIVDPQDPRRAAGFGPISRSFPARERRRGSAPLKWLHGDILNIPQGFDWSYFQAAPADQRIGYLRGDEWIALDGLHAALPHVQMRLPGARGRAFVYGLSAFDVPDGTEIEMRADTLRIDGADQRCTLLWRGRLDVVESALASIRIAAGVEIEGEPLTAPEPASMRLPGEGSVTSGSPAGGREPPRSAPQPSAQPEGTLLVSSVADRPVTPFRARPVADLDVSTSVPAMPLGQAAVASVVFRWRGELRVTAIAKATFAFAQGGEMPLVAPVPIVVTEVNHERSPTRSVRQSADVAPYLERVDVLFCGHAHAPPNSPQPRVAVRLALASDSGAFLDKRLIVLGDRAVTAERGAPEPAPFQTMPIVYERSFGGIGFQDNPIGVGFESKDGKLPNILHGAPAPAGRTAGFGAISTTWLGRRQLLRGHPARLLKQPVVELPDDFAWGYFQSAPEDQQIRDLPPRAWIVLEGMHPQHSMLHMRLPPVRAAARLHGPGGASQTTVLRPDTLVIDGDAERCTVTFRGSFLVQSVDALAGLCIFAGVETPSLPLVWPSPPSPAELAALRRAMRQELDAGGAVPVDRSASSVSRTLTVGPSAVPRVPPVPFAIVGGAPRIERSEAPIPGAPWSPVAAPRVVPASANIESTVALAPDVDVRQLLSSPTPAKAAPPPADVPGPAAGAPPPPREAPALPKMDSPREAAPRREAVPGENPWGPAPPRPPPAPAPKAPRPVVAPSSLPQVKKSMYGKFGKG